VKCKVLSCVCVFGNVRSVKDWAGMSLVCGISLNKIHDAYHICCNDCALVTNAILSASIKSVSKIIILISNFLVLAFILAKVKLSLRLNKHRVVNSYGTGGMAPHVHDLGITCRCVSGLFNPRERGARICRIGGLGGPQRLSGNRRGEWKTPRDRPESYPGLLAGSQLQCRTSNSTLTFNLYVAVLYQYSLSNRTSENHVVL
jgi:hypothetical protein